jgi:hypothetical protein
MKEHATTADQRATVRPSLATPSNLLLQRKCACGTRAPAGKCEECARKAGSLQRKPADKTAPREVPAIVHEVLGSGSAQSLDPATRAVMEPRLGHDFSRVRVHTDDKAAESARAVNAVAYTVGRDVVFDAGQYAPETPAGQRLLAHELTHVVQQRSAAATPPGEIKMGAASDALEADAHASETAAAPPTGSAGTALVQRQIATTAPSDESAELDQDFARIVAILDERHYSDRDEGEVIAILRRWAGRSESAGLGGRGRNYLDDLFTRLTVKTTTIGVVVGEVTSYYSLIFNHFDRVGEVRQIRDRYSQRFQGDEGIAEVSLVELQPRTKQFIADLIASIRESPQYAREFITGDLWDTIREHWPAILAVTLGLMAIQAVIAALGVAPTGVTQIIAAILEIIVLAVLGYFAAVEIAGVIQEAYRWWTTAREANGDATKIADASRAFVRMVWHILMAVLALLGLRARVRTGALERVAAPIRTPAAPTAAPTLRVIQGGDVRPVRMEGGRVVSQPRAAPRTEGVPVRAARGSAQPARAPEPVPEPIVRPVPRLVPAEPGPVVVSAPRAAAGPRPGLQPVPAVGAGVALAPDVLQEEETDEHGCRYEPIAMKFGRYPCHADFAASLSGDRREFRVTTPEGLSVDFDAMDHGRTLYEVKTGYGWLLSSHPAMQDRISATRDRFIAQSVEQTIVAERCGRPLRWYFNNEAVALDFEGRIQPPVIYRPFRCDVDSDR